MKDLDIEKFIKIKCIEQDIGVTTLASKLDMSHQLMWHHIKKKNNYVLNKIEKILKITKDTLKNMAR